MKFEFDKEMDSLLRQAAQGESASANDVSEHLDADEISAFAENALPEKTRQFYTAHLADCGKCRKILSSVIALNSESEPAIAALPVVKTEAAAPWYRKFFALPIPAYALGALVLIFSGIAFFTILQSGGDMQNAEISQTSERQTGTAENFSSDAPIPQTFSNANVSVANTAMMANTNTSIAANASATANTAANKPEVSAAPAPKTEPRERRTDATKDAAETPTAAATVAESAPETRGEKAKNEAETSDSAIAAGPPPPAPMQTKKRSDAIQSDADESISLSARRSTENKTETASVGGKTFNRRNNVWYDAAYKNQATTNITRGTDEYKKLYKNLRVIAENLGGTVVIVWKEKAYRIR